MGAKFPLWFRCGGFFSPLGREWIGKGIELAVDLRLVSSAFGTVCLGVKDEGAPHGDEGSCSLQNAFVPSRFHIKHLCQSTPVLYFKGNSYQASVVHVSSLAVREISPHGLKPVVLLVEKKLEAGEKIALTPLWRTDGSTIKPAPWSTSAMLVEFAGTGSIHATLPHEAAGHKARLTVELRSLGGAAEIEIILGDDGDSEKLTTRAKHDPATYHLERVLGRNGYVRISHKGYGREEVLLNDAYVYDFIQNSLFWYSSLP